MIYVFNSILLYIPAVAFLVFWVMIKLLSKKSRMPFKKVLMISVFYLYIMLVLGVTLFPIGEFPADQNFIPFKTIIELITRLPKSIAIKQILGNVIMFMPFGFLVPFFLKDKKFIKVIGYSLVFTLSIEFMQFIIGVIVVGSQYRSVDIDDVILNFLGGIIGYLIFVITLRFLKNYFLVANNSEKI